MEIDKIKLSDKHVLIMRGISGSGKSTFVERFKKLHTDKDITVVSADHFFMKNGEYVFDKNKLAIAHGTCKGKFERALQKGTQIVIVDNTNLKYQEMKPYVEMAEAAGYEWNIIQIESPVSVILERQKSNKNLGEDIVHRMADKMKTATFGPDVKKKMIFIQGTVVEQ